MHKKQLLRNGFLALTMSLTLGLGTSCNTPEDDGPSKPNHQQNNNQNQNQPEHTDIDNTDQDNTDIDNTDQDNTDSDTDGEIEEEIKSCHGDEDCAADEFCLQERCSANASAVCHSDSDCTLNICDESVKCLGGNCQHSSKAAGTACNDNDPCTLNDACNQNGECVGQEMECTTPPTKGCDENNDKFLTYNQTGTCVVNGSEASCEYNFTSNDCDGDCANNCASKCAKVECQQDDSCFNIACDPSKDGTGTALCAKSTTAKAQGTACKINSSNKDGFCLASGSCVECLKNDDCPQDFECSANHTCTEIIPECTQNTCNSDTNELVVCQDKKITQKTTCPFGCNETLDGCAEPEECTNSVCKDGVMKYCSYNKTAKKNIYSDEIKCSSGNCNSTNTACQFYCTFQWVEADAENPTTAVGYGRTEKSVSLIGGGLICSSDLTKAVSSWSYGDKPTVNRDDANGTTEWVSANSKLATDTNLYCTFLARVSSTLVDNTAYNDVRYICPAGDHDQTNRLNEAIIMDPTTTIDKDRARIIKLTTPSVDLNFDHIVTFDFISESDITNGYTYKYNSEEKGYNIYAEGRTDLSNNGTSYAIDGPGLIIYSDSKTGTKIEIDNLATGVGTLVFDVNSWNTGVIKVTTIDGQNKTQNITINSTGLHRNQKVDINDSNITGFVITSQGRHAIDNIRWTDLSK